MARAKCALVVIFVSTTLFRNFSFGQDERTNQLPPAWVISRRPLNSPLLVPQFDRLCATLLKERHVRVIVRLNESRDLARESAPEGQLSDEGRILARRKALGQLQETVLRRLSSSGVARARKFQFIPFLALEADASDFFSLLDSPEIDLIQEDIPVPPLLTQSVSLIGARGDGTFSGYSGTGVAVAILDTGVDTTHPFLTGKIVSEACYSSNSQGYSQSLCPNGQESQTGQGSGVNCSSAINSCYHGTHVAGIAAGASQGWISGVAKDASIIAVQVFSKFSGTYYCGSPTDECALSWTSDQVQGLERVYELKDTYSIASANMSLGGGLYSSDCDALNPALKAAIDNLRSAGIATVIAAGNSGSASSISEPACISSAVSVGATTKSDIVAGYSNSASILDLFAPGSSIVSSLPESTFGTLSGTSMAAPHVAGAWAVIKSRKSAATVDEVLTALKTSGVPITDSRSGLIKPRIEVDAALARISIKPASILWRNLDGRLAVWNMEGVNRSGVTWLNSQNSDANWTVRGMADFSGDGNLDILWRHSDGRLAIWIMDGSTRLGVAWPLNQTAVDNAWSTVGVADFDGDGRPDIYWRHTDGRLAVWNMNGVKRVGVTWLNCQNPDPNWIAAGVADFSGNGKPDILWRHTDGRIAIWNMEGIDRVDVSRPNGQVPVDNTLSVAGVADIDSDGRPDILWRQSDGKVVVWLMSGGNHADTVYLINGDPVGATWNLVGACTP